MSMILLAVEDAVRDAAVRDLLTAEGWWVTTVVSQEEALRAAADHAPQLLIVDAALEMPGELLRAFARQEGGPGVLVLVDHKGDAVPRESDGVVWRDQAPSEILAVVRRSLHAPRTASEHATAAAEVTSEDEQLTTSDLFGDILENLDGEVSQPSTEPELELVLESEADPVTKPQAESESSGAGGRAGTGGQKEVEPQAENLGPELEYVPEPEFVPEPQPEADLDPELVPEAQLKQEPEPEAENLVPEPEHVPEPEYVPELEFVPEAEAAGEPEVSSEPEDVPAHLEAEEEVEVEAPAAMPEGDGQDESRAAGADDPDWTDRAGARRGSPGRRGFRRRPGRRIA